MSRFSNRLLALAISISIPFSLCACKKKTEAAGVVKEDDPYFESQEIELLYPKSDDLVLEQRNFDKVFILNNLVLVEILEQYQYPEDFQKRINKYQSNPLSFSDEEVSALFLEMADYQKNGFLVYDLSGNYLGFLPEREAGTVTSALCGKDGTQYLVTSSFGEAPDYDIHNALKEITAEGKIGKEIKLDNSSIPEMKDSPYAYTLSTVEMENGNFLCAGLSGVVMFDKTGKCLGSVKAQESQYKIVCQDGKYYLGCYHTPMSESDPSYYYLLEIGTAPLSLGKNQIRLPAGMDIYYLKPEETGIFQVASNGFDRIRNLQTFEKEPFLRWADTDCNYSGITEYRIASERELFVVRMEDNRDEYLTSPESIKIYLLHLTKAEKNPHAGKKIITIAGPDASAASAFLKYLNEYNRDENRKARIVFKNYFDNGILPTTWEERDKFISETTDKLFLDLLSGSGPDILMNFGEYSQFNNETVLLDLNTLLDGKEGLNRSEYFDNVFRASETNGKLFQMPITFRMTGMIGNSKYIGNPQKWTFDDFKNASKNLPENVTMIPETTWSDLLEQLLQSSMRRFVDYDKKEVHFDDPEFAKILEVVKEHGSMRTLDQIFESRTNIEGFENRYILDREMAAIGLTATAQAEVSQLMHYAYVTGSDDGEIIFVGNPSSEEGSMSFSYGMSVGISKASRYQEEAWDFVKYLFGKEVMTRIAIETNMLPVCRASCEEKLKEELSRYEDSLKHTSYDADYIKSLPKLDNKMVSELLSVLDDIHTCSNLDMSILLIIKEEVPGYLHGQRSIEDVVKNIQNRAATVVKERG
ncbi:MAG: extracellular solute-binding protein [Clostridiales bacterium]|nr:extracellular solute-binding protein [Clostridiales bacterium]